MTIQFVKTGATTESELGMKIKELGAAMAEAEAHAAEMGLSLRESLKNKEAGEEGAPLLKGLREGLEGAIAPLKSLKLGFQELFELDLEFFAVEKIVEMGKGAQRRPRGSTTRPIGSAHPARTVLSCRA